MTKLSKLVFFGTEDFSLPSLKALIGHDFNVVAVVTKPDFKRGRGKKLEQPAVKQYALEHGIQVFQPEKLKDIRTELEALRPVTGILVSYGKILPEWTINVFDPIGIINVHPSLLPQYRGPAPIEAAILGGDTETGISIMRLDAGMDTGPVFIQERTPLIGSEIKPELATQLAEQGANLLVTTLPAILSGELQPTPQQNDDATYTSLISKDDGIINPLTDTAYAIERKVRAYLTFPKTRLTITNNDVIITSAKVVKKNDESKLIIPCAENTYLEILTLIAPSGKAMSGEAYLRGYRI